MLSPERSYEERYIRFMELWEIEGWRLKAYGISLRPGDSMSELFRAARHVTQTLLPVPAATASRYGVGFVGIHAGRDANVVFVDWWGNENELHHHPHLSPTADPKSLRPASREELTACAWDIALICFERAAWIEAVLDTPDPSLDRYLEMKFDGRV